jgi:hypothetical protein
MMLDKTLTDRFKAVQGGDADSGGQIMGLFSVIADRAVSASMTGDDPVASLREAGFIETADKLAALLSR